VAKALYARILAHAHLQGVGELFLLTNTAEGFFSKIGFHKTIRDSVPESIKTTKEFQSLCPSTTVCMAKRIDKQLGEHE
jgi:amino-acid N-acetyltransferase